MSDLFDTPAAQLEAGQIIIWSDGVRALEEHLIHRAKYHGEGEHPPQDYVEIMQDILLRTRSIRRGAVE